MDRVVDYGMEFSIGNNYLSKLKGFDISWKLLSSKTIISSGTISFTFVNSGIPIFPPK